MHFARRQELGIEILQAAAFALLVGFVYHYFGPSSETPPTPQAFGALTVSAVLIVATLHRTARVPAPARAEEDDTLSKEQTRQLTDLLLAANWLQLEKVVGCIYAKLGCATWRHSNVEGENNYSLVIERAGHRTAVMCKPWKDAELTSPEIIEFSTELRRGGMAHGVLVSLRESTLPALSVAGTLGIDIVNREGLVNLLTACGQSHRAELMTMLNEGRKYCPNCDQEMVLRTATTGLGAGEQFWRCRAYPQCRCTEPK